MDSLARYYTENIFSDILINGITILSPKVVLDLGTGAGALTNAAAMKWKNAKFIATDVDGKQIKKTENNLPKVKVIQANGLDKNLNKKLRINIGEVDVAICNPPYLKLKSKRNKYQKLFDSVGLTNCSELRYLTADLVFLAQNLRLLKNGGELGIILPDGLITNHSFELFRADLLKNHIVKSVIQLPDNIFKGTEARTYILIIEKGMPRPKMFTNLILLNKEGLQLGSLKILSSELVTRMDFNYHKWKLNADKKSITLKDINASIKRGSFSHKEIKEITSKYFHTTDFQSEKCFSFKTTNYKFKSKVIAKEKDILIARVGKRCIGKVGKVTQGNILLTDCVYRLRVPRKYYSRVWRTLNSSDGEFWFKSFSHGVCSQVISKSDLLNFPITK